MEYHYHDLPLREAILKINGLKEENLQLDDFSKIPKEVKEFADKLIAYKDKRFFIVGDYDCDGICATAIIKQLFNRLNIKHNYYIPSRIKDGYGVNERIINNAITYGFEVVLLLDNGIRNNVEIKIAKDAGLKVMIIDHHEYDKLPNVDGLLHPSILPDNYDDLCTGGLCALLASSFGEDKLTLALGALASKADIVKVLGYNRYLLKKGFSYFNDPEIYALQFLNGGPFGDYDDLSFNVVPKINAISRMEPLGNPNHVVSYLLGTKEECANKVSLFVKLNDMRKAQTKEMAKEAHLLLKDSDFEILYSPKFKEGLCGLLANQLVNSLNKPVVVLSENNGILKGSGRSPDFFNIYEYLLEKKDLFVTFGGHAFALGLSMEKESLAPLEEYVSSFILNKNDQYKDVIMLTNEELNFDTYAVIESLKPFGPGLNEPLLYVSDFLYRSKYPISNKYPRFNVSNELSAISFNTAFLNRNFKDIVGYLRRDNYRKKALSFVIEDLI